jgi:hypothetical protein
VEARREKLPSARVVLQAAARGERMIDTNAAEALNSLPESEQKQLFAWMCTLELVHAIAINGLTTIRLAMLGLTQISGTVDVP